MTTLLRLALRVVVKPTKELSHFSVPPFLFLIHIHKVKMTLTKTETKKGQPSMLVSNQHRWLSFSLISPLVPKINAKAKK